MLSDLIDPVNMAWNNEMLGNHLLELDADIVWTIPLPTIANADCWSQCHEKSGSFMVRSAYICSLIRGIGRKHGSKDPREARTGREKRSRG